MDEFVLDVSACMPWCCEDETTPASEEMLEWAMDGSALHVPSLWAWEILNTVAVVIKRRRIRADCGGEFLEQLATLNFKVDDPPPITDFPRLHALDLQYCGCMPHDLHRSTPGSVDTSGPNWLTKAIVFPFHPVGCNARNPAATLP